MKKKSAAALLFLFIAFFYQSAFAQVVRGCCHEKPRWYTAISASAVFLEDVEFNNTNTAYTKPDGQTFDIGFGLNGAIGYHLYPNLRAEIELGFKKNEVNTDPGSINGVPSNSSHRSVLLMANGYYDFNNRSSFVPYIGAGIGIANVKASRFYEDGTTKEKSKSVQDYTIAYQFMTGMGYKMNINSSRPVYFVVGYRYLTGDTPETSKSLSNFPTTTSFSNDSHNIDAGVRIYF